jgi:hypothetical protein
MRFSPFLAKSGHYRVYSFSSI